MGSNTAERWIGNVDNNLFNGLNIAILLQCVLQCGYDNGNNNNDYNIGDDNINNNNHHVHWVTKTDYHPLEPRNYSW